MWTQLKPACELLYTKLVCSVNGAYYSRVVRLFKESAIVTHVVLLAHFIMWPGIIVPIIVIIITAIVFG